MPENFDPERYAHRRPPEDGPERYAPPHRRLPETRDDGVKNVVTLLAKQQPEASAESISATEHLDVMIRRIAMDSMTEIGRCSPSAIARQIEGFCEGRISGSS